MIDLNEALAFSQKLALKVGSFLLKNQKRVKVEGFKDRRDIVTNIDLQAEKIIISAIEKKYLEHNIISEEKGSINKNSEYTWYIDPLDGTKEYLGRIPTYNTCFCLFHKKRPILSVIYLPYSNQLFSAVERKGAFFKNKKIKVNNQKGLKNSIIYINLPIYKKLNNQEFKKSFLQIENLTKSVYRVRGMIQQSKTLAFLARGSFEAVLNFTYPTKAIEDTVPGLFIAQMAGAKITDLKGVKLDFSKPKQLYIASNSKIHDQLIKILNSQNSL